MSGNLRSGSQQPQAEASPKADTNAASSEAAASAAAGDAAPQPMSAEQLALQNKADQIAALGVGYVKDEAPSPAASPLAFEAGPSPSRQQNQRNADDDQDNGDDVDDHDENGRSVEQGQSMDIRDFASPTAGGRSINNNTYNNSGGINAPSVASSAAAASSPSAANDGGGRGAAESEAPSSGGSKPSTKQAPKIRPIEEPPIPARPMPISEKDIPPRLRGLYGKAELLFFAVILRRTATGVFAKNKPGLLFMTPTGLFILDMSFQVTRYVPLADLANSLGVWEESKQVLLKPINDVEILISFPDGNASELDATASSMARACGAKGMGAFIRTLYAAYYYVQRTADTPPACNPPMKITKMTPDAMAKSLARSARAAPTAGERQSKIEMKLKSDLSKREGITRPGAAQAIKRAEQEAVESARQAQNPDANKFKPDERIQGLCEDIVAQDAAKRTREEEARRQQAEAAAVRGDPIANIAKNVLEEKARGEAFRKQQEAASASDQQQQASDGQIYFRPESDLWDHFDPARMTLRLQNKLAPFKPTRPPTIQAPHMQFAGMPFRFVGGVVVVNVRHNMQKSHALDAAAETGAPILMTVGPTGNVTFWQIPLRDRHLDQFNCAEELVGCKFAINGHFALVLHKRSVAHDEHSPTIETRLTLQMCVDRKNSAKLYEVPDLHNNGAHYAEVMKQLNLLARNFIHDGCPNVDFIRPPPPPPVRQQQMMASHAQAAVAAQPDSNHHTPSRSSQGDGGSRRDSERGPVGAYSPQQQQQQQQQQQDRSLPQNQQSGSYYNNAANAAFSPSAGESARIAPGGGELLHSAPLQATSHAQIYARTGALPRVRVPGRHRETLQTLAFCYANFVKVVQWSLPDNLARTPTGAPHPLMVYMMQPLLLTINPTGHGCFWRPMTEAPLWSFSCLHDIEAAHFRRGGLISLLVRPYGGRSAPQKMTLQPLLYRDDIAGDDDPDEMRTVEADPTLAGEREELIRACKALMESVHALAPNVNFKVDRPDSSRANSIASSTPRGVSANPVSAAVAAASAVSPSAPVGNISNNNNSGGGGGYPLHETHAEVPAHPGGHGDDQRAMSETSSSAHAHAVGPTYAGGGGGAVGDANGNSNSVPNLHLPNKVRGGNNLNDVSGQSVGSESRGGGQYEDELSQGETPRDKRAPPSQDDEESQRGADRGINNNNNNSNKQRQLSRPQDRNTGKTQPYHSGDQYDDRSPSRTDSQATPYEERGGGRRNDDRGGRHYQDDRRGGRNQDDHRGGRGGAGGGYNDYRDQSQESQSYMTDDSQYYDDNRRQDRSRGGRGGSGDDYYRRGGGGRQDDFNYNTKNRRRSPQRRTPPRQHHSGGGGGQHHQHHRDPYSRKDREDSFDSASPHHHQQHHHQSREILAQQQHHRDRHHHAAKDYARDPRSYTPSEATTAQRQGRSIEASQAMAAALRGIPQAHAASAEPVEHELPEHVDGVKVMGENDWRSIIMRDPVTAATLMVDAQQQWEMERAAIAHELLRMHEERSLLLSQNDSLHSQIRNVIDGQQTVTGKAHALHEQCYKLQQQLATERKIRQQAIDDNVYKTERFFESALNQQTEEAEVLKERLRRLEGVLERVGDAAGSSPKFATIGGSGAGAIAVPAGMHLGSAGPFSLSAIGYAPPTAPSNNNNNSNSRSAIVYPPGTTSGALAQLHQQQPGVNPPRSARGMEVAGLSPSLLVSASAGGAAPMAYYGGPSPPRPVGAPSLASPYASPLARANLAAARSPQDQQQLRYSLMMDT